jgi:hypothetical protein
MKTLKIKTSDELEAIRIREEKRILRKKAELEARRQACIDFWGNEGFSGVLQIFEKTGFVKLNDYERGDL